MPDTPRCAICRQQYSSGLACWAWHRFCQEELNPVALIGVLDKMPQTDEVQRITRMVAAWTGMDIEAVRTALRQES